MAQTQLHEAAAAAESRALGEAAQALQGEQHAVKQTHLLVPAYLLSTLHRAVLHSSVSQQFVHLFIHACFACLQLTYVLAGALTSILLIAGPS